MPTPENETTRGDFAALRRTVDGLIAQVFDLTHRLNVLIDLVAPRLTGTRVTVVPHTVGVPGAEAGPVGMNLGPQPYPDDPPGTVRVYAMLPDGVPAPGSYPVTLDRVHVPRATEPPDSRPRPTADPAAAGPS